MISLIWALILPFLVVWTSSKIIFSNLWLTLYRIYLSFLLAGILAFQLSVMDLHRATRRAKGYGNKSRRGFDKIGIWVLIVPEAPTWGRFWNSYFFTQLVQEMAGLERSLAILGSPERSASTDSAGVDRLGGKKNNAFFSGEFSFSKLRYSGTAVWIFTPVASWAFILV